MWCLTWPGEVFRDVLALWVELESFYTSFIYILFLIEILEIYNEHSFCNGTFLFYIAVVCKYKTFAGSLVMFLYKSRVCRVETFGI